MDKVQARYASSSGAKVPTRAALTSGLHSAPSRPAPRSVSNGGLTHNLSRNKRTHARISEWPSLSRKTKDELKTFYSESNKRQAVDRKSGAIASMSVHPQVQPPIGQAPAMDRVTIRATIIDSMRRAVFSYLVGQDCSIFDHLETAPAITERELDDLTREDPFVAVVLLRGINARLMKTRLERKKKAEREAEKTAEGEEEENKGVSDEQLAALEIEMKDVNAVKDLQIEFDILWQAWQKEKKSIAQYFRSPRCALLAPSLRSRILNQRSEIDKIIHAAADGAGYTVIAELERQKLHFHTIEDLLKAVQRGVDYEPTQRQLARRRALEKNADKLQILDKRERNRVRVEPMDPESRARRKVLSYLVDPVACRLFTQAREVKATASQIDALIKLANNSVPDLLHYLRQLDQDGFKFMKFTELTPAVDSMIRRAQSATDSLNAQRMQIAEYLCSEECTLFQGFQGEIHATVSELDQVIEVCGGVENALHGLEQLNQQNESFMSVSELLGVLYLVVKSWRTKQSNLHKQRIIRFLQSPQCEFFSESLEAKAYRFYSPEQIDALVNEGEELCLFYLTCLHDKCHTFDTFDELVSAVGNLRSAYDRNKQSLLMFFLDPNQTLVKNVTLIQYKDVEDLYVNGAGPDTFQMIDDYVQHGAEFETFEALTEKLHKDYTEQVQAKKQLQKDQGITGYQRKLLWEHLSEEDCTIFVHPEQIAKDPADLNRIIMEAKDLASLLFFVSILQQEGKQFNSTEGLVLAIRELVATARAEMIKVQEFLQDPNCTLLPRAEVGILTDDDYDYLYVESLAGPRVLWFMQQLVELDSEFSVFEEIVIAIRHLVELEAEHGQMIEIDENDADKQLKQLQQGVPASKGNEAIERGRQRNILLRYFMSPECHLFSGSKDVRVDDAQLDMFLLAAQGLEMALTYLRYMDDIGLTLTDFQALKDKLEVLMRSQQDDLVVIHKYLLRADTHLLTDSMRSRVELNLVKDLFLAAGPYAILHLQRLSDAHYTASNFDSLVAAVASSEQVASETRRAMKRVISTHLNGPVCNLFETTPVFTDEYCSQLLQAGGYSASVVLYHLYRFEKLGLKFLVAPELVTAVESAARASYVESRRVLSFLKSKHCHLLPSDVKLDKALGDKILEVGGAGSQTLVIMWAFNSAGRHFKSVKRLIAGIKTTNVISLQRENAELLALGSYLCDPTCAIFVDPNVVTIQEDDLLQLSKTADNCYTALKYVENFDSLLAQFHTVGELTDAVAESAEAYNRVRQDMLDKLVSADCQMFNGAPTTLVSSLTMSDMDMLFSLGEHKRVSYIVDQLEAKETQFVSFDELLEAVRPELLAVVQSQLTCMDIIRMFLTSTECFLLPLIPCANPMIKQSQLRKLFRLLGNGALLLKYLLTLNAGLRRKATGEVHYRFSNFVEVENAVRELHADTNARRMEITEFLFRDDVTLLRKKTELYDTDEKKALVVDRVMKEAGDGAHAAYLLWYLSCLEQSFDSPEQLARAIERQYHSTLDRRHEERLMLIVYLCRPDSTMYEKIEKKTQVEKKQAADSWSPDSLDRLRKEGKSLKWAFFYCTIAESEGFVFHNVRDLSMYVRKQAKEALETKSEVLRVLYLPECCIFSHAKDKVQVTKDLVEQMYGIARGGRRLPNYVKRIEGYKRRALQQKQEGFKREHQMEHFYELSFACRDMYVNELVAEMKQKEDALRASEEDAVRERRAMAEAASTIPLEARDAMAVLDFLVHKCQKMFTGEWSTVPATERAQEIIVVVNDMHLRAASALVYFKYYHDARETFESLNDVTESLKHMDRRNLKWRQECLRLLTSSQCALLPPDLKNALDLDSMTMLMENSMAGPYAVMYLEELLEQEKIFTSLDELISKVWQVHMLHKDLLRSKRHILRVFLSGPEQVLDHAVSDGITRVQLDELISCGRSGSAIMVYLRGLLDIEFSASTFECTLAAIETNKQKLQTSTFTHVLKYLQGSGAKLLADNEHCDVSNVTDLITQAGTGDTTLAHLWSLCTYGVKNLTMEQLTEQLKSHKGDASQYKVDSKSQDDCTSAEKLMILTFFSASTTKLFQEDGIQFSERDLLDLFAIARNPSSLLFHLQNLAFSLQSTNAHFGSYGELKAALQSSIAYADQQKRLIADFLTGPRCTLFALPLVEVDDALIEDETRMVDTQGLAVDTATRESHIVFDSREIDRLYEESCANNELLIVLNQVNREPKYKHRVMSFRAMIPLVNTHFRKSTKVDEMSGDTLTKEQVTAMVHAYLSSEDCQLLHVKDVPGPTDAAYEELFDSAGSCATVALKDLNARGMRFDAILDIVEAIEAEMERMKGETRGIVEFFKANIENKEFLAFDLSIGEGMLENKHWDQPYRLPPPLDQVFASRYGMPTRRALFDLTALIHLHRPFMSVEDIRSALEKHDKDANVVTECLKLVIWTHLAYPNTLFNLTALDTRRIDYLYHTLQVDIGLGVFPALLNLKNENDTKPIREFDTLIKSLQSQQTPEAESEGDRLTPVTEQVRVMLKPPCALLSLSVANSLGEADVKRVVDVLGVDMSVLCLKELAFFQETFDSIDALIARCKELVSLQFTLGRAGQFAIYSYLDRPAASPWSELKFSREDLNNIEGGAVNEPWNFAEILLHLQAIVMEEGDKKLKSTNDLVIRVQKKKEAAALVKREIGEFLLSEDCHVFQHVSDSEEKHNINDDEQQQRVGKAFLTQLYAVSGVPDSMLLHYIKKLNSNDYHCSSWQDLASAVYASRQRLEKKSKMQAARSDSSMHSVVQFVDTDEARKLLPGLPEIDEETGVSLSDALFDMILEQKKPKETLVHLEQLSAVGREFVSLNELRAAIEKSDKLGYHIEESAYEMLLNHLQSDECTLFPDIDFDLVKPYDIDATVIGAGNITHLMEQLKGMQYVHRRFASLDDFTAAVGTMERTHTNVDESVRDEWMEILGNMGLLEDEAELYGRDLDEFIHIVGAEGATEATQEILNKYAALNRKFETAKQLADALSYTAETGSCVSAQMRSAIMHALMEGGKNATLVQPTVDGVALENDAVDRLLLAMEHAKDIGSLMQHLDKFTAVGMQFDSINALVEGIRMAERTGAHVPEAFQKEIVDRLTTGSSRLIGTSQSTKKAVMFTGRQIDDMVSMTNAYADGKSFDAHLNRFVRMYRSFDSADDFLDGLRTAVEDQEYVDPYVEMHLSQTLGESGILSDHMQKLVLRQTGDDSASESRRKQLEFLAHVLEQGGGYQNSLGLIKQFKDEGLVFPDDEDGSKFLEALKSAEEKTNQLRRDIREMVAASDFTPLVESERALAASAELYGTSKYRPNTITAGGREVGISADDFDMLEFELGIVTNVKPALEQLLESKKVYNSFAEMVQGARIIAGLDEQEQVTRTQSDDIVAEQQILLQELSDLAISNKKGQPMSALDIENFIYGSPSSTNTKYNVKSVQEHVKQFQALGVSFASIDQLDAAIVDAEKNKTHVPAAPRNELLRLLLDKSSSIVKAFQSQPLDELVQAGENTQLTIDHVKTFAAVDPGVTFDSVTELIHAIHRAKKNGHHVDDATIERVTEYLTKSGSSVLDAKLLQEVSGSDWDKAMMMAGGTGNFMGNLRKFKYGEYHFNSFTELMSQMDASVHNKSFTTNTLKDEIKTFIDASSVKGFTEPLDNPEIDDLLYIGRGWVLNEGKAGLKPILEQLATENVICADAHELYMAVKKHGEPIVYQCGKCYEVITELTKDDADKIRNYFATHRIQNERW